MELLSEETQLGTKPYNTNAVLAIHNQKSAQKSSPRKCTYYHAINHLLLNCPKRTCYYCKKTGPEHYQTDYYKNPSKNYTISHVTAVTIETPHSDNSTLSVTINDIAALLNTAMSATSSISQFFDSGYCNHITSDSTIFTSKNPIFRPSSINTADDSQLHVSFIRTVATSNLSLPATFHILK